MTEAQNRRMSLMARLLGSEWNIRYNAGLGIFQADLRGVEVREGNSLLWSAWGGGTTADVAVTDYLMKIAGRTIVMEPASPRRREVFMPDDIVDTVFGD